MACFSGGKDSLVSTHFALSELADVDIEKHVVFVDTTVMLPIAVDFVKEICRRFNWPLTILQPNKTFWEQAEEKGMPSIKRRWCCWGLKLQPINDFVKQLKPQRAEITGLRRDESPKRAKLPIILYKRRIPSWGYAPILLWTEKDVFRYLEEHDLPIPPQYRMGFKETCMCGCFAHKKEIMLLKATYPELFQRFVELEGKFRKDWACWSHSGKPLYAKDLAQQSLLLKYVWNLKREDDRQEEENP